MKVLILFAHPAFQKSKANRIMVEGLTDKTGVTFHDLYQEYPELDIDIKREQALLQQHDVIVFQFPLFWYSTPALLKEWQDMVLEHGWAYGTKGKELKDKLFMCSITAGGPREAYQITGFHKHTINQLLSPLHQSASLCKMIPLPPFVVNSTHSIDLKDIKLFKKSFDNLMDCFVNDKYDLDEASKYEYMNDYLTKQD